MDRKDGLNEFNRQSMIKLNKKDPFIIPTNPGFFDHRTMDKFGYQEFDVVQKQNKNYLTVNRSIIHDNKKIDLNTSVYELDEDSRITKMTESVVRKIRSILPIKGN